LSSKVRHSPADEGFRIDDRSDPDIILIEGRGFWTPPALDEHFHALAAIVSGRRSAGRRVRVLLDLRQADVQPGAVVEHLRHRMTEIYARQDKVAIVVASRLAKFQMRRCVQRLQHEFFLSTPQARAWLGSRS
jgi:hypothetical protein